MCKATYGRLAIKWIWEKRAVKSFDSAAGLSKENPIRSCVLKPDNIFSVVSTISRSDIITEDIL